MTSLHDVRYPNESEEYRERRDALLREELDLRARVEALAERRRALPAGGRVPEDYELHEATADGVRAVRLSELFEGHSTLLVYNYMYGPDMKEPCSMCTPFLDGMDGQAVHIAQRVGLAVVAKSPPERLREWVARRGWRHLRLLSWQGTGYGRDYHAEIDDGSQITSMNVFAKNDDGIHHTWSSEIIWVPVEKHDPRHIDLMWPLWNALDLTPEGRGDWIPPLFPPALR